MMMLQPGSVPAGLDNRRKLLAVLYDVYADWAAGFSLACRKGCAACCTRSVTMTSLEGSLVLEYSNRTGRGEWLRGMLDTMDPGSGSAGISMNCFAEACLRHREIDGDAPGCWDFTPCMFLEDKACSIYEVRPFGCRSFGSLRQCDAEHPAEMTPLHLTVNTVFTQIIEHLSSDGGHWSTMADILSGLAGCDFRDAGTHLRFALPVPGFLLEPHEVPVIGSLLQQISKQLAGEGIRPDLIDNFMLIL